MIERALNHDMSAQAKIEFLPGGVRAFVRAPVLDRPGETAVSGGDNG